MTIQKTLHIVWVGPHAPPDTLIDSWRSKHTLDDGWEFVLHRDLTGWAADEQIKARAGKKEWNGVADLIRWEILYKMGGIVVDADSECIRQLDDQFLEPDAWAVFENETVKPGIVSCGAMGSVQGAEFYKACFEASLSSDSTQPAWKAVGPMLITNVWRALPSKVKVFPSKLFIPEHFSGVKAPGLGEWSSDPAKRAPNKEYAPYGLQRWGTTLGYNALRSSACRCLECTGSMIRFP